MILGGLFLNRLFRLFGTSFVSQLGSGGSLPCVRRALSGEKKTDIYPRLLLSRIHTPFKLTPSSQQTRSTV
jgi:hypothetical protein